MHIHTNACIEHDVEDMGDDGDGNGYQAWDYYTCKITGETHRTLREFNIEQEED